MSLDLDRILQENERLLLDYVYVANYPQLHNLFVFYYSSWKAKVVDGPVSSAASGRPGTMHT